jgi:hypothetical protein
MRKEIYNPKDESVSLHIHTTVELARRMGVDIKGKTKGQIFEELGDKLDGKTFDDVIEAYKKGE